MSFGLCMTRGAKKPGSSALTPRTMSSDGTLMNAMKLPLRKIAPGMRTEPATIPVVVAISMRSPIPRQTTRHETTTAGDHERASPPIASPGISAASE
jgi:hypothetical protein